MLEVVWRCLDVHATQSACFDMVDMANMFDQSLNFIIDK